LPEAQLDRFLLTINLGYPLPEDEIAILSGHQRAHPLEALRSVVSIDELREAQERVREVYVDELIKRYIVAIVQQTRRQPELRLGASPRGSLSVFHCAQAWAAIDGRDYVTPDDVKLVAVPALSHRLIGRAWTESATASMRSLVSTILSATPVPGNFADRSAVARR
jgi:MoxR-like ATPase